MPAHGEVEFIDIDAFLPRPAIPPALRNPRIVELEAEVNQLQERCTSLSDINERRSEMHRMQKALNERLDAEIDRQKTQIQGLQTQHNDAIERMAAQDSEARDYRVEIDYLRGRVNELQPPVDQLNGIQLQLKTYRLAVGVLYDLLRDSHPTARIKDILAQCKAQVLDIDAAKGIFHPAARQEEEEEEDGIPTVGDFIDDIASEASQDDSMSDEDSLHDFINDGEDIQKTPPHPKRKRRAPVPAKEERDDKDFAPRTPRRARIMPMGAPLTPPSSQRTKLPRKAKVTPNGSAFYNLKRLSDAGRGDQ